MLLQYSIKLLCIVSCLITLIGCKKTQEYTIGEWIRLLNTEAGIESVESTKEIEITLSKDNEYYEDFQKGKQWEYLPNESIEPEHILTKEYVAYTLVHLCDLQEIDTNIVVKDIDEIHYPDEVKIVLSNLLMVCDEKMRFNPTEPVSKEKALEYAKCIDKRMNHKSFTHTESKINLEDSLEIIEETPLSFNPSDLSANFDFSSNLKEKDIVQWNDGDKTYIYEISKIDRNEEGYYVQFVPFDIVSYSNSISLKGNTALDFSNLDLYDDSGIQTDYNAQIKPTNIKTLSKTFQYQDFTIELRGTSSSLSAKVYKKCVYGTTIDASIVLTNVHATYAFKTEDKNLKNAYFKLDFNSNESLNVKNGIYKNLYGDFSEVNKDDFLATLSRIFKEKNDVQEKTLTLCTFTVPIPEAPMLNITMSLELHLSTSGKASISFKQESGIGFETKNGAFRTIKELNNTVDTSLKGTTEMTTGITVALNMLKKRLMDASLNAGLKGEVTTVVNLYDSEGNLSKDNTDISTDIVDELAEGNDDVLVCSNVRAYWSANLGFNSSSSFVGKFGFGKKISLLNSKNAVIPNLSAHYENGHKVEKCTRNSRKILPTAEGIVTKEQICLADYAFAIRKGQKKQIVVTGLPKSYTVNDLIYTSNHSDLASVDGEGNVYGISCGSVEITIQTKDKKHIVHCSAIVMEK